MLRQGTFFHRTVFCLLVSAALSVQALPARAQGAAEKPLKIAVIDLQQVFQTSVAGKKALGELQKLAGQKEAEGKAKQQELKDLQAKLDQGKLSLSQDKLDELQKQMEDRVIAARRWQEDAKKDVDERQAQLLSRINELAMPVIERIVKQGSYTLVLRKIEDILVYADPGIDITAQVVKELDTATPKEK